MKRKFPVIFILGPTASGKSEIALEVAKKINAEIISGDSMQAYKKFVILTAVPSPQVLSRLPHHLVSILEPSAEYSAADFARRAKKEIVNIIRRGRTPLVVGGSGLYLRALLDGIFSGPGRNKRIRDRLSRAAEKFGVRHLYLKLKKVDPRAAAGIHPNDLRRIIRALEVFEITRRPISDLRKKTYGIAPAYRTFIFGLDFPRERLYRRIEKRVEQMFKKGAVKEVKNLRRLNLSRTAAMALGIKEINGYLNGEYSLPEARARLKKHTRHFAKRQFSWFRKDKRIFWFHLRGKETAAEVAGKIYRRLKTEGFNGTGAFGNN